MSSTVYVGGLNNSSSVEIIKRFFRKFGHIRDIFLKNGFCFVEYSNKKSAEEAFSKMNGSNLLGDQITVRISKGKVVQGMESKMRYYSNTSKLAIFGA